METNESIEFVTFSEDVAWMLRLVPPSGSFKVVDCDFVKKLHYLVSNYSLDQIRAAEEAAEKDGDYGEE